MTRPVTLADVLEEERFGGKAASLGRSLRGGLPVPDGFGLDVDTVEEIVRAGTTASATCEEMLATLGGRVAVRSSAVGEDARDASFAGQHLTILNAASAAALLHAIGEVRQSAHSASALAYRVRMGVAGPPRIAIVVQRLIDADRAGVLFTRNPTTGAPERLIEAAWGLGEVVVSGAVVPDSYRLDAEGAVLERTAGVKDVALRLNAAGGTTEVVVEAARVHAPVLGDADLAALHELALRCEAVFGRDLDLEWAFEGGRLFLLQCRSITR